MSLVQDVNLLAYVKQEDLEHLAFLYGYILEPLTFLGLDTISSLEALYRSPIPLTFRTTYIPANDSMDIPIIRLDMWVVRNILQAGLAMKFENSTYMKDAINIHIQQAFQVLLQKISIYPSARYEEFGEWK